MTRKKILAVVAALALAGSTTACANQQETGGGTVATAEATPGASGAGGEAVTPDCYLGFEQLDAGGQQECRVLIAGMDITDVNRLEGLDEARWANYYRHVALGERGVLHNVVRTSIIDDPSGAESAALHFLTGHQANIYRLTWLMHNKPAVAQDPRTIRALLGTDRTDTETYTMAVFLAENISSEGQDAETFITAAAAGGGLFTNIFPEDVQVEPHGDGRKLSFTAEARTTTGTPRRQTFTYIMYPYMEARQTETGHTQEKPDDPNDPGAELFARLGTPLLAGPVQISDATS